MAPSFMENSLELDCERWAAKYRGCCGCLHLKKAAAIVGVFDFLVLSASFARGIQIYLNIKSSPVTTSWLVISTLLLFLGVVTIFAMWYGIVKDKSLWILPLIVLKIFTIMALLILNLVLLYLVYNGSKSIIVLLVNELDIGYKAAKSTVKVGGTILITILCLIGILNFWTLSIIYDSYRYVKKRELYIESGKLFPDVNWDPPPIQGVPELRVQSPDSNDKLQMANGGNLISKKNHVEVQQLQRLTPNALTPRQSDAAHKRRTKLQTQSAVSDSPVDHRYTTQISIDGNARTAGPDGRVTREQLVTDQHRKLFPITPTSNSQSDEGFQPYHVRESFSRNAITVPTHSHEGYTAVQSIGYSVAQYRMPSPGSHNISYSVPQNLSLTAKDNLNDSSTCGATFSAGNSGYSRPAIHQPTLPRSLQEAQQPGHRVQQPQAQYQPPCTTGVMTPTMKRDSVTNSSFKSAPTTPLGRVVTLRHQTSSVSQSSMSSHPTPKRFSTTERSTDFSHRLDHTRSHTHSHSGQDHSGQGHSVHGQRMGVVTSSPVSQGYCKHRDPQTSHAPTAPTLVSSRADSGGGNFHSMHEKLSKCLDNNNSIPVKTPEIILRNGSAVPQKIIRPKSVTGDFFTRLDRGLKCTCPTSTTSVTSNVSSNHVMAPDILMLVNSTNNEGGGCGRHRPISTPSVFTFDRPSRTETICNSRV